MIANALYWPVGVRGKLPDPLHKSFPILLIAKGRGRDGRFAWRSDPRESLHFQQLEDLRAERSAQRRQDHQVDDILERGYGRFQSSGTQDCLQDLLAVEFNNPLSVPGLDRHVDLHPDVLWTKGLECSCGFHLLKL